MSRQPLDGKLAIVTGSSRGIGRAIATKLASYGANIGIGYTSASSEGLARELARELKSTHGVRTALLQADLSTTDGPASLVAQLKAAFPPESEYDAESGAGFQIDILINNAGVALNSPLPAVTATDFERSYRTNVLGPLLLTQAATPYLPRDRSGRIVNLSSVSASTGFVEQSVYGGTKAALEAMTRTWARELAERCTVNAVNPGPVMTDMYERNTDDFKRQIKPWIEHTPLMRARKGIDPDDVVGDAETSGGRPAYVDEVAGIVAMLCGEDAAWCTGQVVCANGGMLMLH